MQGRRSRIHAVFVRAAFVKRLVEAEFRLAEVSRQKEPGRGRLLAVNEKV